MSKSKQGLRIGPGELKPITVCLNVIKTEFEDTGPQRLCFAIIERAIIDLTSKPHKRWKQGRLLEHYRDKNSAYHYLNSHIPHAENCGVCSEWIRSKLINFKLMPKLEELRPE